MVRGFKKSIKEEVVKNPTQPIQQVFQKMQMYLVESKQTLYYDGIDLCL